MKEQLDRTISLLSQTRSGKLNVTLNGGVGSDQDRVAPSYELRRHRPRQRITAETNGLIAYYTARFFALLLLLLGIQLA